MATYYVWSGGSNTSPYDTWAKAATAFGTAVSAATAANDFIYVHYTHQEELAADTTYTTLQQIRVISVNKDSSDAPTPMSTGGWIGNSTTNRSVTFSTVYRVYLYGITFRTAGTTADSIAIAPGDGGHLELENCYLWHGNTSTTAHLIFGQSVDEQSYVKLNNTTLRFGATAQGIQFRSGRFELENCTISSSGSSPNTMVVNVDTGTGPDIKFVGCDLSHITGTLIGSTSNQGRTFQFAQCKLGANVTPLAVQTPGNKSSNAVYIFDCASGDSHGLFGYYDALGSCVSDTGIYFTNGAASQSWKISTTSNCSFYTPFVSPFVDFYNTQTSSITPYFEILRDGNTAAYQDNEVWGEFFIKKSSGSTQSTEYSDRMALLGTAADQSAGDGAGSWTGAGASVWSGKVDSGSAVTPAENGHIRGRVVVGKAPSIFAVTVYVNPQIRT